MENSKKYGAPESNVMWSYEVCDSTTRIQDEITIGPKHLWEHCTRCSIKHLSAALLELTRLHVAFNPVTTDPCDVPTEWLAYDLPTTKHLCAIAIDFERIIVLAKELPLYPHNRTLILALTEDVEFELLSLLKDRDFGDAGLFGLNKDDITIALQQVNVYRKEDFDIYTTQTWDVGSPAAFACAASLLNSIQTLHNICKTLNTGYLSKEVRTLARVYANLEEAHRESFDSDIEDDKGSYTQTILTTKCLVLDLMISLLTANRTTMYNGSIMYSSYSPFMQYSDTPEDKKLEGVARLRKSFDQNRDDVVQYLSQAIDQLESTSACKTPDKTDKETVMTKKAKAKKAKKAAPKEEMDMEMGTRAACKGGSSKKRK